MKEMMFRDAATDQDELEEALARDEDAEWERKEKKKKAKEEMVRKKQVISFPKVIDMDTYLMGHYKQTILNGLNKELVRGTLENITGKPVRTRRIEEEDCRFNRISYWRLNRETFLINIEARLQLQIGIGDETDTDFYWIYIELVFCFGEEEEEETCEYVRSGSLNLSPDYEDSCWKLDQYLVPVLKRDEIDLYSTLIWETYLPGMSKGARIRWADELANAMGLKIRRLPLYRRPDTEAMIFFRESTVKVRARRKPGEKEDPPPEEERVAANTIVINADRAGTVCHCNARCIYHECIHWEWHYLFYRLQNMYHTDLNEIEMTEKKIIKISDCSNPVEFMEDQAEKGSYGLMLPKQFMIDTVRAMYRQAYGNKRTDENFDHRGRRFESIARWIADSYFVSKSAVRARMLQLGYAAARGALNYVDGGYITPFDFSEAENARGSATYVIDRKTVGKLYEEDEGFRNLMESGHFAYVDGHVAYIEQGNVLQTPRGARLSGWANANIDRACLRFSKEYTGKHKCSYTFGQMNSEEALKQHFKFLDANSGMTIRDLEGLKDKMMEEMPVSFHGTLAYIMKGRATVDDLVGRIPISRSTLLRLRTEERKQYDLDQVVAICVGLHLPPWLSEILLDKAGLTVKRYGPKGYYGTILDCFFMDTIEEVQAFLKENGYDQLKLNYEKEIEQSA